MTVRLTSPVLGQAVGASYTGTHEAWLLGEGYAVAASAVPDAWTEDADGVLGAVKPSVTVTPTAATLVGSDNAATLTASGNVVFATKGGVLTTVALVSGDLVAAAATKIDTALAGKADAAIVSSKLNVVSTETGPKAYVKVISGNATILGNLKLAVGQEAWGGDGLQLGSSNTGVQATTPANDPTVRANREAPKWPATPEDDWTIANDGTHLTETHTVNPDWDFDASGTDTEAPSEITLVPNHGPAGTRVQVFGQNLEGVTKIQFKVGASAAYVDGVDFDDDNAGEGILFVTTPAAHADFDETGPCNVFLDDGSTDTTLTDGFIFEVEE